MIRHHPAPDILIQYAAGSLHAGAALVVACHLEGCAVCRGETGTPWRRIERANISLALAEPEPLTLAKRTTKSFTLLIGFWTDMMFLRGSYR